MEVEVEAPMEASFPLKKNRLACPPHITLHGLVSIQARQNDSQSVMLVKTASCPDDAIAEFIEYAKKFGARKGADHEKLRAAAHAFHRFPHEPTQAQIKAGNYSKRKVDWNGLTISIENEAGSVRRGVDRDGHAWETRMVFPYGYALGSLGVDGDNVDCYLGPDETAPMVYVIHQRKAGDEPWIA